MKLFIGRLWVAIQNKLNSCASAYTLYRIGQDLAAVGENTLLSPDLQLDFAGRINIADWVYVGSGGKFFGRGGLTIADHVIIGPQVTIMTSMHKFKDANFLPYDEHEILKPVKIGEASWIGYGVIIMPGIEIGRGCIVGAGSVVTNSFSDGSIIAGNPAKLINQINIENINKKILQKKTYLFNKITYSISKIEITD